MSKDRTKVIERIQARTKPENKQFVRKNLEISYQISQLMKEKGWSQKDLAKKLDKTPSELSKILSGLHNITLKTLSKIEAVLNQEVITTPIEACKKYRSTEYVTFFVAANDQETDAAEKSTLNEDPFNYKEDSHQPPQIA